MTQPDPILAAFTAGALTLGWLAIGVFFLKFWRRTGDGLFLAFAIAFALLATNQGDHPLLGRPAPASTGDPLSRFVGRCGSTSPRLAP